MAGSGDHSQVRGPMRVGKHTGIEHRNDLIVSTMQQQQRPVSHLLSSFHRLDLRERGAPLFDIRWEVGI